VPGTINITATYSCTAPVTSLSISIYLYLNDLFVSQGSAGNSGSANLQANAYSGCTTGTYKGVALGHVVFPPGYTPPASDGSVVSNSSFISCP
jgi:hypothetical protein